MVACGGGTGATGQEETVSAQEPVDVASASVIPKVNGVEVEPGLIFAGQPTDDELRALKATGGRVLDLRGAQENRGFDEIALVEELGLEYLNVPVDGPALMDPAVHAAFRAAINKDAEGPLLVHCASGNRVAGLYYAMLVEEGGVPRSEALARAKALGLTSQGVESGIEAYLDRD